MTVLTILAAAGAAYVGLVGWWTFGRGAFRFEYNAMVAPWVRRIAGHGAMTIGARAYVGNPNDLLDFAPGGFEPMDKAADDPVRRWWRHERQHNRQWRVRPFMAPVYLFWALVVGYVHNPLELEAKRAEDVTA